MSFDPVSFALGAASGGGGGGGSGLPIVNATEGEGTLTLDITAGELYALMQNGPVATETSMSDDSYQGVRYDIITDAGTDGTFYAFMSLGGQSASGFTSTDTVVFSQPK